MAKRNSALRIDELKATDLIDLGLGSLKVLV
jgi:hypothetical protein